MALTKTPKNEALIVSMLLLFSLIVVIFGDGFLKSTQTCTVSKSVLSDGTEVTKSDCRLPGQWWD